MWSFPSLPSLLPSQWCVSSHLKQPGIETPKIPPLHLKTPKALSHLSVNPRENHPSHSLAVLIPTRPILLRTSLLISPATMNQQNSHEQSIRPRQQVFKSTRSTHGIGQDEITQIIHVSSPAPPSRAEQNTFMLQTIMSSILDGNDSSWWAPEVAFAFGAAN